ncbi:MAG TPA: divalent metal cation transporter [Bryobacteraceae bacterium]|nr:divalent metal cation transporter [Bryobacteraceae bacterium]
MKELLNRFRYHILLFIAVLGPGFITANVDNDSGGIYTYSAAGARFGYLPLWTLVPITVLLIIVQEMCSRMGAVTGKGLSDLIREEFGLRITFVVMALLVLVNLANVMSEFAGVASSLGLFGISKYLTVPLSALAVWFLVVKGNYQSVEKIFLFACVLYISYVISGFLVKPDWKEAAIRSIEPKLMLDPGYIYMLIGMVGTTIAPWMQFYLQSAVVEKGVSVKEYAASRVEVIVGCIVTDVVAFFIIVACAGAYSNSPRDIQDASEAALALKPFGKYAFLLFSAGLFNASIFAACILPLSTAYSVCEGLGFESGVNRRLREAPIFYFLYTLLIVVGAGLVLIPRFPLVQMILFSQVLNGMLLPLVLIFMILLINKRELMGEWINPRWLNLGSWISVVVIIGLTMAYIGIQLRGVH